MCILYKMIIKFESNSNLKNIGIVLFFNLNLQRSYFKFKINKLNYICFVLKKNVSTENTIK